MRTLIATLLALLLIIIGVVIFGMASVRILQASGLWRIDIDTASATLDAGLAVAQTPDPMLAGVENGGMALGTPLPQVALRAAAAPILDAPPVDVPPFPSLPATVTATPDPCPPQMEAGFAADATVAAIGMLRLYSEPDMFAPTLGEFGAGQNFLVTADSMGVTAVRRCDLVWVRLRLTGGSMGWALGSAVDIALPTAMPTMPPICPGGCATPACPTPCYNPCAQPCPDPCNLPCTQPCTTPCGVYSQ